MTIPNVVNSLESVYPRVGGCSEVHASAYNLVSDGIDWQIFVICRQRGHCGGHQCHGWIEEAAAVLTRATFHEDW